MVADTAIPVTGHGDVLGRESAWGAELRTEQVRGVPFRMFSTRPRHVSQLMLEASRFSDRTYLVEGDRRMTFDEFQTAVALAASSLRRRGVSTGDRVLILGANGIDWVVAFWATLVADAIVVPGNAWWSEGEITHAIELCSPRVVVCDASHRDSVSVAGAVTFDELAGAAGTTNGERPQPTIDENLPAALLFTSGTTGLPKAVVLSHRSVIANLQSLLALSGRLPQDQSPTAPPSVTLISVPLFHVGGFQQLLTSLVTGGRLVFTGARFDGTEVLTLMEREGVRVWSAVPTMLDRVVEARKTAPVSDLSSVRTVTLGGASVSELIRAQVRDLFPNAIRGTGVSYGLTEAGGVVSTSAGASLVEHPGTVGRPAPIVEVQIADSVGFESGEILVRSAAVMDGYWGESDSASPVRDGWLYTGDLGRLDDEGFLYVTGRSKDIIIRGGENIACPLVENSVALHPAVRQVAVVGLPDDDLGESVGAVVVLHQGTSLSLEELRDFLRGRLAYFAIPTRLRVRADPLPTNAAGKVLKRVLTDEWLEDAR